MIASLPANPMAINGHQQQSNHHQQIHSSSQIPGFESVNQIHEEMYNRPYVQQMNVGVHHNTLHKQTNVAEVDRNHMTNQQYHHHPAAVEEPTLFGKLNDRLQVGHANTNVNSASTLETEDQYQQRFRFLHDGNLEKFCDQDGFNQLSSETLDSTGNLEQLKVAVDSVQLYYI